jgi:hypothetical protein
MGILAQYTIEQVINKIEPEINQDFSLNHLKEVFSHIKKNPIIQSIINYNTNKISFNEGLQIINFNNNSIWINECGYYMKKGEDTIGSNRRDGLYLQNNELISNIFEINTNIKSDKQEREIFIKKIIAQTNQNILEKLNIPQKLFRD